ncbi:MAG: TIGR02679 family protein [Planctomycetota bacterium]|nr:TIGR02679 family protein [Planctomycetota bacterium]
MDQTKLEALLGAESLRPLIRKLDRRLAKKPEVAGHVTLKNPSDETREAVTALLGLPPKVAGPVRVSLAKLEQTIRDSGAAADLTTALTRLLGRKPQHPAVETRKVKDEWQSAWQVIAQTKMVPAAALDYFRDICSSGVLRRAARGSLEEGQRILQSLAACITAIPPDEPTPLPVFAAHVLGDSHALDIDRPICTLLLRTIRKTSESTISVTKENHRQMWSEVNIIQDELSSTVLVLNLPTDGTGLLGRMLSEHATIGEPCRLTFRQLRIHALSLVDSSPTIFVCENPSILAAAASQLGRQSRPLICIEGQPSHASAKLLTACKKAGARLLYHGDFDRAGLQIAAQVLDRFAAEPWRMAASDYRDSVSQSRLSFEGPVPSTPWDSDLADEIRQHRKALLEESVVEVLLKDLVW